MKTRLALLAALMPFLVSSCQESIEDHAARDTREYTDKYCPVEDEYTILDSMTFDRPTRTVTYHYRVKDVGPLNPTELRAGLLTALRNTTQMRAYKEAGFSYRYLCLSVTARDSVILDVTFQPSDYQQ